MKLNVGGTLFTTRVATMCTVSSSALARSCRSWRESKSPECDTMFLDMDAESFRLILNCLRNPALAQRVQLASFAFPAGTDRETFTADVNLLGLDPAIATAGPVHDADATSEAINALRGAPPLPEPPPDVAEPDQPPPAQQPLCRATNASTASAGDVPKTNELQQLPEQTAAAAAAARLFGGYGGEPVECTAATEDGASAPAPVPAAAILMAPHAPSGSKKAGRPRFSRKQLAAVVAVVVAIAAVVAIVLLATDSDMDASCTATAGELGPAVPWAAATDGSELSITLTGDVACAVGSPCSAEPAARRRSRSRTPGGTCESNAGGIVPAARRAGGAVPGVVTPKMVARVS